MKENDNMKNENNSDDDKIHVTRSVMENAEEIRSRSVMCYALYEASSVLGIHKWTQAELKHEADRIYYGN